MYLCVFESERSWTNATFSSEWLWWEDYCYQTIHLRIICVFVLEHTYSVAISLTHSFIRSFILFGWLIGWPIEKNRVENSDWGFRFHVIIAKFSQLANFLSISFSCTDYAYLTGTRTAIGKVAFNISHTNVYLIFIAFCPAFRRTIRSNDLSDLFTTFHFSM